VKKVIDEIWGTPHAPAKESAPAAPTPKHAGQEAGKAAAPVVEAVKGAVTDAIHKSDQEKEAIKQQARNEFDTTKKEVEAAIKARECDLPCFKECLGLKKYAPYPVIETCVTKKCKCDVSIPTQSALELISVDLIPEEMTTQGVGFFGFLWRFFLAVAIGFAIYLGVRKLLDYMDDRVFNKERMDDFALGSHSNDEALVDGYKEL
jgi:hypothetical protein